MTRVRLVDGLTRRQGYFFGLLLVSPVPGLENVAATGGGSELGGTRLTGWGETHFVTVLLQYVDAEHDFFVSRNGVHLLWGLRFIQLDRTLLAGGVLRRPGEAERVPLKNDRGLLHLFLGQDVAVFRRRNKVPRPLESIQVCLRRRRWRLLAVACCQQQTKRYDHLQLCFHGDLKSELLYGRMQAGKLLLIANSILLFNSPSELE